MAGRVPLENASQKKQNGRTRFGRRLLISEIIIIIIIIIIVKLTHRCINPITSQLKKISY
jgi:hypothetical protein